MLGGFLSKKWTLNIWTLLVVFFFYGIASLCLFVITSHSFFSYLIVFWGLIFFAFVSILLLAVSIFRSFKNRVLITISRGIILLTFLLQSVILLFNYGDCGYMHNSGSVLFFQKIFNSAACNFWSDPTEYYLFLVVCAIYLLYLIMVVLSLLSIKTSAQNNESSHKEDKRKDHLLFTFLSLPIVGIVFLGILYMILTVLLYS